MLRSSGSILLVMVSACGARTGLSAPEPIDAAVDTVTADVALVDSAAFDAAVVDSAIVDDRVCVARDAGGGSCALDLVVRSVAKSSATCFIDTPVIAGARGSAVCADGGARITFGAVTFVGGFDGDFVDVCSSTSFVYTNGCRWRTAQRVFGSVKSGELSFSYNESPEPGESGCASVCSATGTIEAR